MSWRLREKLALVLMMPLFVSGAAASMFVGVNEGNAKRKPPHTHPTTTTPTTTTTPVTTTTPTPSLALWVGDMETGDTSQWSKDGGGGLYNSGAYSAAASSERAHSGTYSLKATITAPPASGVRAFRWKELRANRELYLGAWIYIPTAYVLTSDPCCGQYWDVFQFKSRTTDSSRIDPFWLFSIDRDTSGAYYLRAGWGWGGVTVPGPYSGSTLGGKNFTQRVAPIPVGRWFHLESFIRQSNAYDGTVTVWQDGVKVFDFQNVRTSYVNCNFNAWCVDDEWSVNSYSDGLSPQPATLYIDDARIGTTP